MAANYSLDELAERLGGQVVGDGSIRVDDVATLDQAGAEQLSFLTNAKYRAAVEGTRAAAILVGPGTELPGRTLLVASEPYLALARLLELFHPPPARRPGVSPDARVAASAVLGADVVIGPFAVVEDDVRLGDRATVGAGCVIARDCELGEDTELRPGVVLYPSTRIGSRCLIHSGVVLGADGFGFATVDGEHHKVPQTGSVAVEDEVEIGANSTVDRGALGQTRIGRCSKIDNLVMIAHGVTLGDGSLLAAQSGIAGSTRVGKRAVFAGQSGAAGHLEIADGTVVAAKSAVLQDQEQGAFVAGIPAIDHRTWKRAQAISRRLPELWSELRETKARLDRLERMVANEDAGEDAE
ncbi:MAG: UDP-3-O-(3-hydroxymyristoyl)glucosamine N-acyltransferase [bacterium]|nr:UDP-3-O-(3-hydroxymyristoyl)glucosamine N-acyltransferase [bacterium]